MTNLTDIICPTCKKKGTWTKENIYRPFCSDRCKLIDLGEWAAEKHRIAGEQAAKENEQEEDNKDE